MEAASGKGRGVLFTGVATGLVIAALLVVQAASSSAGFGVKSSSATVFSGSSVATTNSSASASSFGGFYYVAFYDSGPCGANATQGAHFTEWGVTLGNRTRTEPSDINVSEIQEDGSYSATSAFSMTRIVFLVPSGVYPFTLYPTALMRVGTANGTELSGPTGTVTVTDSPVTVYTASVAFSAECSQ